MAKILEMHPCFRNEGADQEFVLCLGAFTDDCPLLKMEGAIFQNSILRIQHPELLEKRLMELNVGRVERAQSNELELYVFCSQVFPDVPTDHFFEGYALLATSNRL